MTLDLTASTVFLFALLTALATGLGAVPFLFVGQVSHRWLGISNAVAAGLMAAASWSLIFEGLAVSGGRTVLGILLGDAEGERGGGAGLGLDIARQTVEAHEGTMWVKSKLGVGTTFYFTLPGA